MEKTVDKQNETERLELFTAALASIGAQKGYMTIGECFGDDAISEVILGVQEEMEQAYNIDHLNNKDGDLNVIFEYIANHSNKYIDRVAQEQAEKLVNGSSIIANLMACKENGVMPYWTTKVIACVLTFCINSEYQLNDFNENVLIFGLNKSIKMLLDLHVEPEFVKMIADHCIAIKRDIANVISDDPKCVELMKAAWKLGYETERKHSGCAQCTIKTMGEISGNFDENVFRACTSLGGGMAGCCDGSCGAYTGGIMHINSFYSRSTDDLETGSREGSAKAGALAKKLHDRFNEYYDGVRCKDVQKAILGRTYNLQDEKDRNEFNAMGVTKTKCTVVVANTCAWIAKMLFENSLI